jgi:hypothetical protein
VVTGLVDVVWDINVGPVQEGIRLTILIRSTKGRKSGQRV